jgi:hypothetical protein
VRYFMIIRRLPVALAFCGLFCSLPTAADDTRLDQVLDAIVANEQRVADSLEQYQPLVETYIQTVKPDPALGSVPVNDNYFFGRLEIPAETALPPEGSGDRKSHKKKNAKKNSKKQKSLNLFDDYHSQTFKPESFARKSSQPFVSRGGPCGNFTVRRLASSSCSGA